MPLTNFNFNDQISKIRQTTNYVSLVHFYKYTDGKSLEFAPAFDSWTNEYRGVFRICAVDCDTYADLCRKEDITEFPTIKLYAPIPIPPTKYPGELKTDDLIKWASKYLHSNVIEITNANVATFLAEHPSVPKVLLFTDKKGVPIIYKGLSVSFEKKLNFGIVRNTDELLLQKYAVKKLPTLVVVKAGEKKPIVYDGKEFNYANLFEFLNIYSEVFVPGGGSSLDSSATKQWMTEIFPEFHYKSSKDICFDPENTLCVIFVTKEKPQPDIKNLFEALNTQYDRKIDRGAKFKFMWLNGNIEKAWGSLLQYDGSDRVVILNPGKRKRFAVHEGSITREAISQSV